MREYTMNKEMTNSKIKATAKAEIMADIIEFLATKYGEENVGYVRTGGDTSKSNYVAVKFADVDKNGEVLTLCVGVDASVKEFETRDTAKRHYEAFSFEDARAEYEAWVIEKEEKAAEAAAKKEKAIAKTKKEVDTEF